MSPKAETPVSSKLDRKPGPERDNTPNQALPLKKALGGTSQDMFQSMDDVDEYLRLLYYGREGSAKSTNAATLAQEGLVIYVNAEGGAKKKAFTRMGITTENLRFWPPVGTPITQTTLDDLFYRVQADLAKNPDAWAGIIFDSSTDITTGMTRQVSDHRVAKSRNKGNEIDDIDALTTDVGDYGVMTTMFADILRKFRDLPMHVVYTALERRDIDKLTSVVTIGPAVTAGVSVPLLGYVDVVIHCSASDPDENQPFRGLTKEGGRYRVKDRFGVLPRVMAEPTAARILAYLNDELTPETDPLQALIVEKKSGKKKKVSKTVDPETVTAPDQTAD